MRFVILIVITLLAVVVGLAALNFYQPKAQPVAAAPTGGMQGEVDTVDVLVARVDIPAGTALNPSLVDRQPWPRNLVVEGFIVPDAGNDFKLDGLVARTDFKARQPLQKSQLARVDEAGFLAANLPAGSRAVTVSVDAISGVAGYIFPGDHVDVMLAHRVPQDAPIEMLGQTNGAGAQSQRPTTAEVLLANIRVLAVNTRAVQPVRDPNAPNQPAPQPQAASEAPTNITLQVNQEDAKKLRLAEKSGTLSLALRSMQDENEGSVGLPVTLLDMSRVQGGATDTRGWGWWGTKRQKRADTDQVIIIRGVKAEAPVMQEETAGGGIMPPAFPPAAPQAQ